MTSESAEEPPVPLPSSPPASSGVRSSPARLEKEPAQRSSSRRRGSPAPGPWRCWSGGAALADACTGGSLSGLVAAARAGLGVMAHTRGLVPPGLARVGGLPELGTVEFALLRGPRSSEAADALAAAVLSGADRVTRSG